MRTISGLTLAVSICSLTLGAQNQHIASPLDYSLHMSDCENRWVALSREAGETNYTYGFVYIDPQAGFTLQYGGLFSIDSGGGFHPEKGPITPDKMNLKIRL